MSRQARLLLVQLIIEDCIWNVHANAPEAQS
jgi:hypothetical protein